MKQSSLRNLQCFLQKTSRQKGLPGEKKMNTGSNLTSQPQDGTPDAWWHPQEPTSWSMPSAPHTYKTARGVSLEPGPPTPPPLPLQTDMSKGNVYLINAVFQ